MKRNDRFYIDFHVLQTVPPSCINRDDTGSPKTAQYGGVTRARVSSQAWKRAMREYFNKNIESWNSGFRTKKASEIIIQEILSIAPDTDTMSVEKMALEAMDNAGLNRDGTETKALFFISREQAHKLAELVIESRNSGFQNMKTSEILEIIIQEILSIKPETDQKSAKKMAQNAVKNAGIKCNVKDNDTEKKDLFFFSQKQAHKLAELIVEKEEDKKKYKEVLNVPNKYKEALIESPSFDMALFGRMATGEKDLTYDAAAQVAHSISTHAVRTEYDYFTALDDYKSDDSKGAPYLGTTEYNSSTLYRYANINVCELQKTIGENPSGIIRGFAEAFCRSMPTGKQNSFANCTFPDMVYVTIRRDQPINLVGAFEQPVHSENNGFVIRSEEKLIEFAKEMYKNFAPKPEVSFGTCSNETLVEIAELMPLSDLFDKLEQYVKENAPELKGQA